MTEHKTPMVSNQFLGAVSVKLGFHQHIRQNNVVRDFAFTQHYTH